jgi:hypothetical protein
MEIHEDPKRGRGVFCTSDTSAGTLLCRALPFAAVPNDDRMHTHCCVCLSSSRLVSPCPVCQHAVICEHCRASPQATLVHSDECDALRSLFSSSSRPRSTRSLRLLIRLLCGRWRAATCPANEQYVTDAGDWWGEGDVAADELEDIMELCVPPDDAPTSRSEIDSCAALADSHAPPLLWDALHEMAKQARYYLPARMRASLDMGAELMGRACSNSLTVYDEASGDEVGVVVSASVAMFNHDCDPNATWALDEAGCLVVHATRDVRAGEEFCLSYVDPRMAPAARRARLREAFFFECDCFTCQRGVSRWSCSLCGGLNSPSMERCATRRCAAMASAFAAPLERKERRRSKRGRGLALYEQV